MIGRYLQHKSSTGRELGTTRKLPLRVRAGGTEKLLARLAKIYLCPEFLHNYLIPATKYHRDLLFEKV